MCAVVELTHCKFQGKKIKWRGGCRSRKYTFWRFSFTLTRGFGCCWHLNAPSLDHPVCELQKKV